MSIKLFFLEIVSMYAYIYLCVWYDSQTYKLKNIANIESKMQSQTT